MKNLSIFREIYFYYHFLQILSIPNYLLKRGEKADIERNFELTNRDTFQAHGELKVAYNKIYKRRGHSITPENAGRIDYDCVLQYGSLN